MPTLSALPPLRLAEPLPGSTTVTAPQPGRTAAPEAAPVPPPSALPNPTLRLDASLGLVVLELRDAGGAPRTIPSERELAAYRSAARGQGPASERAGTPAPDRAAAPAEAGNAASPAAPAPAADPPAGPTDR